MKKIILNIGGMSCSACSNGLEKYLNKQKGIIDSTVNLVMAQASISYDETISLEDIERYIKEAGFKSLGEYNSKSIERKNKQQNINLIIFTVLALIILYISMSHMLKLPVIPFLDMMKYPVNYTVCLFILTIPFLIYGMDIFKSGIKNLIHKTPNMDTLVSLGVVSSLLYSIFNAVIVITRDTKYVSNLYFESCAIIIFFIKLGRYIDSRSKEKTKSSIKDLVTITPSTALLKVNDKEVEVTIDEVKKGDILIAKPGMKIAVDGVITKGSTHVDESFITGESIPVKKEIGSKLIAGSYNHDGYVEYEAVKIGKDSTISEIVKLVVEATNTKAPISKIADKVSGYFVPTIIVIALITLVTYIILGSDLSNAITHFVTVLVVACPCALGLATPLAMVVSVGMCAKNGILVKKSSTLESAHKIDVVVFDKTGTLTYGKLKVHKIFNYSEYEDDKLIRLVSSLEKNSTHPIAQSLISYAKDKNIELYDVDNFKNIDGIGLKGSINNSEIYIGNNKLFSLLNIENNYTNDELELSNVGCSIIYIIENNNVIGLIGIKDIIRSEALYTIKKLKKMNKEIIMLTGDNDVSAHIVADTLGIDNVVANILPSEKTNIIKRLINDGKKVMMIGDGINDAPSLASATIGVSINGGTDIAIDSSDIILMHDNLIQIIDLINISKKTIINIKENLFWAFFYNMCMIPVAAGLFISMNPMIGSMAMMLSSFTVILNSLRLKMIKLEKER